MSPVVNDIQISPSVYFPWYRILNCSDWASSMEAPLVISSVGSASSGSSAEDVSLLSSSETVLLSFSETTSDSVCVFVPQADRTRSMTAKRNINIRFFISLTSNGFLNLSLLECVYHAPTVHRSVRSYRSPY